LFPLTKGIYEKIADGFKWVAIVSADWFIGPCGSGLRSLFFRVLDGQGGSSNCYGNAGFHWFERSE
jgi:hypothetical protein